jgi:hypothetical protein
MTALVLNQLFWMDGFRQGEALHYFEEADGNGPGLCLLLVSPAA